MIPWANPKWGNSWAERSGVKDVIVKYLNQKEKKGESKKEMEVDSDVENIWLPFQ